MRKILLFIALTVGCVSTLAQDLTAVNDSVSGLYGYKLKGGDDWIILPKYAAAYDFSNRLGIVCSNDSDKTYYVINSHDKKVSPDFYYLERQPNSSNFIAKSGKDSFALYNAQFEPVSDSFDDLKYEETVFLAKKGGMWGIIDTEGKVLVDFQYKSISATGKEGEYSKVLNSCGQKKCAKDGFKKDDGWNSFFEVSNENGHYGIITSYGKVIVPCKFIHQLLYNGIGLLKYYNKTIKPYMLDEQKQDESKLLEVRRSVQESSEKLASIYPADVPKPVKVDIVKTSKGYVFMHGKEQIGSPYSELTQEGNYYIFASGSKYGVVSNLGSVLIKGEYDNIWSWNRRDIFLVTLGGKQGLVKANERKPIRTDYTYISAVPYKNIAVAHSQDNKWWLLDDNGKIVSRRGYDEIDIYGHEVTASIAGYKTVLERTNGWHENPSIAKQMYDTAYNMPDTQMQDKYNLFMLCAATDDKNIEGCKGDALNCIGVMYENNGDVKTAKEYYKMSKDVGNEYAKKNLRRLKAEKRKEVLAAVGAGLAAAAVVAGTVSSIANGGGQNDADVDTSYSSSGSSGSSSSSDTKSSKSGGSYNSMSELNSFQNDKRIYDDCDTQLIQHFNGNSGMTANDVVNIQNKMRALRTKWTAKGKNFPQFASETHSTAGCSSDWHRH